MMTAKSSILQAVELAIRLATKACEDVRLLAREGLRPGPPGLGFDDMSMTHDGERGLTLRYERGAQVKEFSFTLPMMIYRGVYREGDRYVRGDTVTRAGSLWHCDGETSEPPGEGKAGWTLAAKKGRDGKDGINGVKGDKGDKGDRGRDLTQLLPTGEKY